MECVSWTDWRRECCEQASAEASQWITEYGVGEGEHDCWDGFKRGAGAANDGAYTREGAFESGEGIGVSCAVRV